MVKLALRTTLITLRDLWEEMHVLILCNLVWTLSIVPIVTLPAATGAMFFVANKIADGRVASFSDFKHGFRAYFRESSALGGLNLLLFLVVVANLRFYGRYSGIGFRLIQIGILYVLVLWVLMQLYIFPLLLEQEIPSLRLAIRNALLLILKHPVFSLIIGVAAMAVVFLSGFLMLPIVILMTATLALLGNRAVLTLLRLHFGEGGE